MYSNDESELNPYLILQAHNTRLKTTTTLLPKHPRHYSNIQLRTIATTCSHPKQCHTIKDIHVDLLLPPKAPPHRTEKVVKNHENSTMQLAPTKQFISLNNSSLFALPTSVRSLSIHCDYYVAY